MRIYLIFDLINVNDTESLGILNFSDSFVAYYETLFYVYQVWCWEKMDNLQKFYSRSNKGFVGILIFLAFFPSHAFSTCGKEKLVIVR